MNINDKSSEIPIGVSCRTCDRLDCSQRAFPPLHKKFDVDINSRGVSVYVGDNWRDVKAAQNSGIDSVLALYGYLDKNDAALLNPTSSIKKIEDMSIYF